jgi:alkyldihydroxyacetonephosphate synthase
MRRWNGWGDEAVTYDISSHAGEYLKERLGPGVTPRDVRIEDVSLPASRLPDHPLVNKNPQTRLRYSRGASLPDLVALRSGEIEAFTDGVAFPRNEEEVLELLAYTGRIGACMIPWGGGTSVVGGVNPLLREQPVLTLSLERMGASKTWTKRAGSPPSAPEYGDRG